MSSAPTWTPELVKDLMTRQFLQNEDVSGLLPPMPVADTGLFVAQFEEATKVLAAFVKSGSAGAAALASHNVNTAARSAPGTPHKGPAAFGAPAQPRTPVPGSKGVPAAQPGLVVPKAVVVPESSGAQLPPKAPQSASAAAAIAAFASATALPPRTPKAKEQPALPPAIQVVPAAAPPPSSAAPSTASGPATPKRAAAAGGGGARTPKGGAKRARYDWPAAVPTNAQLMGKSRSALAAETTRRLRAQEGVDPDLVFLQPPGEFPLHEIFRNHPEALKALAVLRGASGDWTNDTFTVEEEMQYKRDMRVVHFGPSQAVAATTAPSAASLGVQPRLGLF